MSRDTLKINLKAPEDGNVKIEHFNKFMENLLNSLKDAERIVSPSRKVYYKITALSHTTNYDISLKTHVANDAGHPEEAGLEKFITALDDIQNKSVLPDDYEVDDTLNLKKISNFIPNVFTSMNLSLNGKDFESSSELSTKIVELLGADVWSFGTIKGMLEALNIHDKNTCTIYPMVGQNYIRCSFSNEIKNNIISSIGKYVAAHGEITYKYGKEYPYRLRIQEIDLIPEPEDKHILSKLRGKAKGPTNTKDSEELIRELHSEWER